MNKVSIISKSKGNCLLIGIFLTGFFVLMVIIPNVPVVFPIWMWILIFFQVIELICNFNIYDIYIHDNQIKLITIKKNKQFDLYDFKIYNAVIQRYPVFHLETNKGEFNINYTRDNYTEIIKLFEFIGYKNIEHFKGSVRTYIIGLK